MEFFENKLNINPRQCQPINSDNIKDLTYAKPYSSNTHLSNSQGFTKLNFPINKNVDFSNDSNLLTESIKPELESYKTSKRSSKKIVTSSTYILKKSKFEGKSLKAVVEDTSAIKPRSNVYSTKHNHCNPKQNRLFQRYDEDINTQDPPKNPINSLNPYQDINNFEIPNHNNKIQIPLRDYKVCESKETKAKIISDINSKSLVFEKIKENQISEDHFYNKKTNKLNGKLQIPIRVYKNDIEKDEELEDLNQRINKLSISSIEDLKQIDQDKDKFEDKMIINREVKDFNNENVFKNIEKDIYMFVENTLGCINADELKLDALQKYGIQCSVVDFPVKKLIISGREWNNNDIDRLKKLERAFQLKVSYTFIATKEKPIILTISN
ncbi:hypothetical protein SteCoe_31286 [Stentor coeruleus]|uniref:Uncharacterized protein n=1 Tax=Stentor coeruleus TaxID=5963 RepID=A0A1R2B1V7_9CILI|nr:hypothetical protein SteCoe_31286 [Stentor coeruleus]